MFDPEKPVQTRDGNPARILTTEGEGQYPIIATVESKDGRKFTTTFTAGGLRYAEEKDGHDLVNVSPNPVVYINAYPFDGSIMDGDLYTYDTATRADRGASLEHDPQRLKVELVDGEMVVTRR